MDHKDGKKGQEGVEADLVKAMVGVHGVDETYAGIQSSCCRRMGPNKKEGA